MNPFTSLRHAVIRDEEMDALDLPDDRYNQVLTDLNRVNRVTLAARPTLAFLRKIMRKRDVDAKPLRLLDVGFGHGDMLRTIARTAEKNGWSVDLVGIDLNPRSAQIAAASTPQPYAIQWLTGDYQSLSQAETGQSWDVIISSLVAHHMTAQQRHDFLRFMEEEGKAGWFINDLHRQRLPFLGYPWLATLLMVDPIVRRDGQLSIARSFRAPEWQAMLDAASITGAKVQRYFPWRLCVEQVHSGDAAIR